jgi:hypothetical protein
MRRSEPPLKRLVLAPVLAVVALFVGLQAFQSATAPTVVAGPAPAVGAELPPVLAETPRCRRDRTGSDVDAAAPALTTIPDGHRVTSGQVQDCPVAFDGRRVTFVGELVGDLLDRDGGAWVLVNDDDYALELGPLPAHSELRGTNTGLSVWLPERLHGQVTGLGRPGQRGDLVRIEGVVRRADPADGGGLSLRADRLDVLSPSASVDEPLNLAQVWLAAGTLGLAGALWSGRRLRADR